MLRQASIQVRRDKGYQANIKILRVHGYGTKEFKYGRKTHVAQDIDSTAAVEWKVTTASNHDSIMTFPLIDTVKDHEYILMNAAYDSSEIYMIM